MESFSGHMMCDGIISLMAKGMYACVVRYFEMFLDSISNIVSLDRCNSHTQKVFEVLKNV